MEEGELPEGVLNINEAAWGTIEGGDRLNVAIVMPMWRRAHASAALVANNVGRRLENFTWRILRSERVLQSLSSSQMLVHVVAIQEGGNIRTTPRASPRSSRSLETYYTAAQLRSSTALTTASSSITRRTEHALTFAPILAPNEEHNEDDDGTPTPTPSSPYAQTLKTGERTKENRRSNLGRPAPILKNTDSSGSSKSVSSKSPVIGTSQTSAGSDDLEPNEDEEKSSMAGSQIPLESTGSPIARRYVSTRFSEQVAVSIPHTPKSTLGGKAERSSRSLGETGQKPRKKEHVVHAGSVASRKRPIAMRQRSSQTTTSGRPSPTSPRFDTQQSPADDDEGLTMASSIEGGRRAVSPHPGQGVTRIVVDTPSSEDEEASDDPAAEETTRENTKENASITKSASPLVEPDFRSKFADRSRTQHRSFTNLPSAAWRSTAAAPAAASYQASGMMFPEKEATSSRRGSGRATFYHEIVPLKAPGPAGPPVQDDVEGATSLPRTKSQLTLLLERNQVVGQDTKGKAPANP